jgi:predicted ATP-binding protein involved in virulence
VKVKKIKFNGHKFFGDLEVNFCDEIGEPLNTIVIIGENGAGKTTLLKTIFNMMHGENNRYGNNVLHLGINKDEESLISGTLIDSSMIRDWEETKNKNFVFEKLDTIDVIDTKVIFMPTEVNFNDLHKVDYRFRLKKKFLNVIEQNFIKDIPSLIANRIQSEIYKNDELPVKESVKKICDEINSIFDSMDLEVKLIGLSKNEDNNPLFEDKAGNQFDIESLSSGEKQLFLRALSLKFLDANNSIVLIDEPEISLHPQWQQKIISVYENIGENNQLIIATHSPHVVGDIESKQLRIIRRYKDKVFIVDNERLNETYGHSIENILKDTMKLESVRNEDISDKLIKAKELLNNDLYEVEEFKEIYNYLRRYLGDLDKDIMLLNLEISRRKGVKKRNAESN